MSILSEVQRQHRELTNSKFPDVASIQAIESHLDDARQARVALNNYVDWLTRLAGVRTAEVVAGVWPPKDGAP